MFFQWGTVAVVIALLLVLWNGISFGAMIAFIVILALGVLLG